MKGKRYAILWLTILLGCSLCGCSSEEEYQRLYEEAEEMILEEEYDLAINAYNTIIDMYPDKVETYLARGNAYINKEENYENLTGAIKDYKEALELDPDNVDIYVVLIDAYIRSNAFEVAEELLLEAQHKFNDDRFDRRSGSFVWRPLSSITQFRDLDGNIRKMVGHEPDEEAQLRWYVVYLYADARVSEAILYDAEGIEQRRFRYEYDNHGNCLQELSLTLYGELEISNSTYDEENRLITKKFTDLDGETTYWLAWEYFDDKDIRIFYNADGTIKWREVTEYDEDHKVIRVTDYDANGEITYQSDY